MFWLPPADSLTDTQADRCDAILAKKPRLSVATSEFQSDSPNSNPESLIRAMPGDVDYPLDTFPAESLMEESLLDQFNRNEVSPRESSDCDYFQRDSVFSVASSSPGADLCVSPGPHLCETQPATVEEITASLKDIRALVASQRCERFKPDRVASKVGNVASLCKFSSCVAATSAKDDDSGAVEFICRHFGVRCIDHKAFFEPEKP